MKPFFHIPIMVNEVLEFLTPECGGVFIDGTLGGGGHAKVVLERLPSGSRLIGIDRDEEAILEAGQRLSGNANSFRAIQGNFFNMRHLLADIGVSSVDGILLDLGVSSHQLDTAERGFSYHIEAPLDMRMDGSDDLTAYEVVNAYPLEELARIFREYGEERFAIRIAGAIVRARAVSPVSSTTELAEIIKSAVPAAKRWEGQHPARRTFQAIRIEVNSELKGLGQALSEAVHLLNKGGRLCVITFHSLEDRIAKLQFQAFEKPCTCSPKAPICTCGKKPIVRILTKKPVTASLAEIEANPRSRSAKLRAIEKL